jgi:hypothetical protein
MPSLQAAGIKGFLSGTTDWLSDSDDDHGWPAHLGSLRRSFGSRWFLRTWLTPSMPVTSNARRLRRIPRSRDDLG